MEIFGTADVARRHALEAATAYANASRWGWEAMGDHFFCEPHPKLPCILDPSVAKRGDGWVPCWVLFAGQDLPGWRFYQWVSARNDTSPPLTMEEASEVLERIIADFLFLVEQSESERDTALGTRTGACPVAYGSAFRTVLNACAVLLVERTGQTRREGRRNNRRRGIRRHGRSGRVRARTGRTGDRDGRAGVPTRRLGRQVQSRRRSGQDTGQDRACRDPRRGTRRPANPGNRMAARTGQKRQQRPANSLSKRRQRRFSC